MYNLFLSQVKLQLKHLILFKRSFDFFYPLEIQEFSHRFFIKYFKTTSWYVVSKYVLLEIILLCYQAIRTKTICNFWCENSLYWVFYIIIVDVVMKRSYLDINCWYILFKLSFIEAILAFWKFWLITLIESQRHTRREFLEDLILSIFEAKHIFITSFLKILNVKLI